MQRRALFLGLALALGACSENRAVSDGGLVTDAAASDMTFTDGARGDGQAGGDGTVGDGRAGDGTTTSDGGPKADLSRTDGTGPDARRADGGGPGGCKVDCDCSQGLLCATGKCLPGFAPAYCCTKPGCPSGLGCTNPDGSKGTCPAAGSFQAQISTVSVYADLMPGPGGGDRTMASLTIAYDNGNGKSDVTGLSVTDAAIVDAKTGNTTVHPLALKAQGTFTGAVKAGQKASVDYVHQRSTQSVPVKFSCGTAVRVRARVDFAGGSLGYLTKDTTFNCVH
ncbi:MAG: hypothetical protein IT371_06245 [Deltaproteobacteria bacterium]|nr:hypothetical protein [Deltaproteobacteria bacterium]